MNITFKRRVFNDAFFPYLYSDVRNEIFYGGGGSGKSVFVAQRDIVRIPQEKGYNVLVVSKVAASNHNTTFSEYVDKIYRWKLQEYFDIRGSKGDERIVCKNNQNVIIFGGCKDRNELEKIKGIRAINGPITKIRMEEASNNTINDYRQLNNVRLRGETKVPKQMTLMLNPILATHWIKTELIDKPKPGTVYFEHCETDPELLKTANTSILKTTHIDNKFYGEAERAELLKLEYEDKYYYDVYVLGNWGVLGNVVFSNYIIHDFDYTEDDLENVCQGMDFGFVHASALERLGFKDGEAYAFDEVHGKGWTNSDFMQAVEDQWGDDAKYWDITADSAEPDRIEEWNRAGYRVNPAKKGKGSLKFGIDFLCSTTLHIHASKCPQLAREIQTYKRKEDKDGQAIDDFVEFNDDGIAALRYATEHIWGQWRGTVAEWDASDIGL